MASLIVGQLKLLNHFWAKYSFVIWRQPWKRAKKSKYSQGHSSILHFNKDSIEIPGEDAQCLQLVGPRGSCLHGRRSDCKRGSEQHWSEDIGAGGAALERRRRGTTGGAEGTLISGQTGEAAVGGSSSSNSVTAGPGQKGEGGAGGRRERPVCSSSKSAE